MKDIHECVEDAIFQISFDSSSLIFRASFNRAVAKIAGFNTFKVWSPFVFSVLSFSKKSPKK